MKELLGSLELNRIYQMECLEGMKLIADKSIDMILCDLPYGTTACSWDSVIELNLLWSHYERIIKDDGAIVLFGSQPFSSTLISSNAKLFRYEWIWEKNNSTGFQHANKRPLKKHENILVFYKKQPKYNPQGLVEYNKKTTRGSGGELFGGNWKSKNDYVQQYTNYPVSIIKKSYDKKKLHPTQKPVDLCEYLIRTYTDEDEIVLDNCMGSGTTAVAAIKSKRKFIGFETENSYIELANQRIEAEYNIKDDEKLTI